jgi:hypothetical protein
MQVRSYVKAQRREGARERLPSPQAGTPGLGREPGGRIGTVRKDRSDILGRLSIITDPRGLHKFPEGLPIVRLRADSFRLIGVWKVIRIDHFDGLTGRRGSAARNIPTCEMHKNVKLSAVVISDCSPGLDDAIDLNRRDRRAFTPPPCRLLTTPR